MDRPAFIAASANKAWTGFGKPLLIYILNKTLNVKVYSSLGY